MNKENIAHLRLARTNGVGPVGYHQLIARFGTATNVLDALPDLSSARGRRIQPATVAQAEVEIAAVTKMGARHIFFGDADYPAHLALVDVPPPVLIAAGRLELARRPAVAIVGARNASAAACRFARQLAGDLGDAGVVVISGLARGIDTAAHQGALATGTIAVIGSGLDVSFPAENHRLQQQIAAEHLLFSEYPPGTEPLARNFPHRNRIIAWASVGVVIVEAAPRSGSLSTARLATEAGREVMAVPGSPLDPRAQGCNLLIREGATLVQSAEDVLEAVSPLLRAPAHSFPIANVARTLELPLAQSAQGDTDAAPVNQAEGARQTGGHARLLELLGPVAVAVDELVRQSGLSIAEVQCTLTDLEMLGVLERHAGGRVARVGSSGA